MDQLETASQSIFQILAFVLKDKRISIKFLMNTSYVLSLLKLARFTEFLSSVSAILSLLDESLIPTGLLEDFFESHFGSHLLESRQVAVGALHCIAQAFSILGNKLFSNPAITSELKYNLENDTDEIQILTLILLSNISNNPISLKVVLNSFGECIQKYSIYHKSKTVKSLANSLLIKLEILTKNVEKDNNQLRNLTLNDEATQIYNIVQMLSNGIQEQSATSNSIEALLYLSSKSQNKEILVSQNIMKDFLQFSIKSSQIYHYGLVAIIQNLTRYFPKLTEEEENIKKLHAMSENSTVKTVDDLDKEIAVNLRCELLLKNNLMIVLNLFTKTANDSIQELISSVFLNISVNQKNRGLILQKGGVNSLLKLTCNKSIAGINAAQCLARLGITSDPSLSFRGQRVVELVRPFLKLLETHDTLQQFEGLMALTNLASSGGEARNKIFEMKGMFLIETLILSDHYMVQRAATEAFCNMLYDDTVFESFIISLPKNQTKIRILLALCDSEDFETQRAACGALSVLTSSEALCKVICSSENFIIILKLLEDDSDELVHRAVVCVRNMCRLKKLVPFVIENHGVVGLKILLTHESEQISSLAVESLAYLKAARIHEL